MSTKQVIVVRRDLKMRKGKIAAQAAHASMAVLLAAIRLQAPNAFTGDVYQFLALSLSEPWTHWLSNSFTKICVYVDSKDDLEWIIYQAKKAGLPCEPIVDNGATEFHGKPTLTCCAVGPGWVDDVDKVTGHLPLY